MSVELRGSPSVDGQLAGIFNFCIMNGYRGRSSSGVAQWSEQLAVNQLVVGPTPTPGAWSFFKYNKLIMG